MGEYRTDRSRVADLGGGPWWRTLVAGAATGAGMVALLFLSLVMRDEGVERSVQTLPLVVFVFICAFAGWIVGLFALAAPAWWLLHRLRLRSLPVALMLGAVGAFLGHFGLEATGFHAMNFTAHEVFSGDSEMQYDAWSSYGAAFALSVIGVIVIWRDAYRRIDHPA